MLYLKNETLFGGSLWVVIIDLYVLALSRSTETGAGGRVRSSYYYNLIPCLSVRDRCPCVAGFDLLEMNSFCLVLFFFFFFRDGDYQMN